MVTRQLLRSLRNFGFKLKVDWSPNRPSVPHIRAWVRILSCPHPALEAFLQVKDAFWHLPGMVGADLWGLRIVSGIWLAVPNAISR